MSETKPGFFERVGLFFGEVRTEMTKVVWPTQEQVKTYAIVVLVTTAILAVIIGFWDLGLTKVMQFVFGL